MIIFDFYIIISEQVQDSPASLARSNRLGTVGYLQLAENVGDMIAYRLGTEKESICQLRVR